MCSGNEHNLESLNEKLVLKLAKPVGILSIHNFIFTLDSEIIKDSELLLRESVDHRVKLDQCSDLRLNQRLFVLFTEEHAS